MATFLNEYSNSLCMCLVCLRTCFSQHKVGRKWKKTKNSKQRMRLNRKLWTMFNQTYRIKRLKITNHDPQLHHPRETQFNTPTRPGWSCCRGVDRKRKWCRKCFGCVVLVEFYLAETKFDWLLCVLVPADTSFKTRIKYMGLEAGVCVASFTDV